MCAWAGSLASLMADTTCELAKCVKPAYAHAPRCCIFLASAQATALGLLRLGFSDKALAGASLPGPTEELKLAVLTDASAAKTKGVGDLPCKGEFLAFASPLLLAVTRCFARLSLAIAAVPLMLLNAAAWLARAARVDPKRANDLCNIFLSI